MKILKIRGGNLASLYGDFELDFTASPLFGCGLFTITGETGAGKSTILDAMCLALYGRFPRITGDGPKDKVENSAGESLQTSDPRSILRTGCAQAHAQVDLMIGDKHLRAIWQVRRARGKAEGNLLDFERSLVDLADGSVLASGKKRVDEEITHRLKLTYEQFGRTVLLAQNDFDAFLRANDSERADLLEKITGTELYTRISAKAFDTEREALRVLEDLQQKTGFIEVLPAEERAELQDVIKSTEQSQQKRADQAKQNQRGLDWYERRDEAVERIEAAQKQLANAEKDLADWSDQKELLAKLEIAARLQSDLDKVERGARSLNALREDKETQLAEQERLRGASGEIGERVEELTNRFAKTKKHLADALPLFEQALKLDTQISTLEQRETEARNAFEQTGHVVAGLHKQHAEQEATMAQQRGRLDALEQGQRDKGSIEPVSRRKNELAPLFQRLRQNGLDLGEAKARLEQAHKTLKNLQTQLEREREAGKSAREKLATVQSDVREKTEILNKMKPDKVRLERDHQSEFQTHLVRLHHHLSLLVEQSASIDKITNDRAGASKEAVRARKELDQFEQSLDELKSRSKETDGLAARSASLLSKPVLELRAALQQDEPCPVCGSSDHPGHDDDAAREVLELMRARTVELAAQITKTETGRATVHRLLEHTRIRIESADERLSHAREKLKNLEAGTRKLFAKAENSAQTLTVKIGRSDDPQKQLAQIAQVEENLEHRMVDVQKKIILVQQIEKEIKLAGEQLSGLETEVQKRMKDWQKLERDEQQAQEQVQKLSTRQERLVEHKELALDQLVSLLGAVDLSRGDLERDPGSAEQFVNKEIALFETRSAEINDIKKEQHVRERDGVVLGEKIAQQSERLQELEKDLEQVAEQLQAQRLDRGKLFGGALIIDVRAKMDQAHEEASKALQRASAEKQQNNTRLEEVAKTLNRLNASQKTAIQAQEKNITGRNSALIAADLELAEAMSLLAISLDEREKKAREYQKRVENKTRGAALLADRKQHLEQINNQSPPEFSIEQLRTSLEEIEADRAMMMIDLGKNKSRLELDDKALKKRAKLSGKIEKVEKNHALWAVINGAIGSRDGAKFRRFAQGITLEHLVALANGQLRNINPRYKIERNRIGGLGLQVLDVEMGDEIRSVRSLSGGERFLVSLALALALSQLDGRSSFVDTLMIDEGFGALDARSLDIVIEALESLQSQGRKVGVISHVEALTDRIPVQIKVEKQGNGRSRVKVVEAGIEGVV